MLWGDLKTRVRRTLLADTADTLRYTDDVLADAARFALNDLAHHTALPSLATDSTADGEITAFDLPADLYELAAIAIVDGTEIEMVSLADVSYFPALDEGYYVWANQFNVIDAPAEGVVIKFYYYAYYPYPDDDADEVTIPGWMESAAALFIAAYALSWGATKQANIRQWGQKPDTGDPEDNSLMQLQKHYFKLADQELLRYPRQTRENFRLA